MWGLLAAIAVLTLAMWVIDRARRTVMAEQEASAHKSHPCGHHCCHCSQRRA